MAKIYNSDLTKGIAKNAGIQQSAEKVPNELAEKVVPTMETNPALLRKDKVLGNVSGTASGAITVLQAADNPRNKKTFVTGLYIALIKDAACDVATGTINLPFTLAETGALKNFYVPVITLTASHYVITYTFKHPMELQAGTAITFNATYTTGTMIRAATIYGYQIDNPNA